MEETFLPPYYRPNEELRRDEILTGRQDLQNNNAFQNKQDESFIVKNQGIFISANVIMFLLIVVCLVFSIYSYREHQDGFLDGDSLKIGCATNVLSSSSKHSSITAGCGNKILGTALNSTIGGGLDNTINTGVSQSAIIGGYSHNLSGDFSAIVGGQNNGVSGNYSAIVGGGLLGVSGGFSAIVGGVDNDIIGDFSAIVGGQLNGVSGDFSAIIGGNTLGVSGNNSVIVGGLLNGVSGNSSAIIGGASLDVLGDYCAMVGGNQSGVSGDYSGVFVGGGNNILDNALYSAIVGGQNNGVSGNRSAIVGGVDNDIIGDFSAIVGGDSLDVLGDYCAMVGGNQSGVSGDYSGVFVGGGNNILDNALYSAIVGGQDNGVSGNRSAIVGGYNNRVPGNFSASVAGEENIIRAVNTVAVGGTGLETAASGSSIQFAAITGKYNSFGTSELNASGATGLPGTSGSGLRFVVGDGSAPNNRTNAFSVDDMGNVFFGTSFGTSIYARQADDSFAPKAFTLQHPVDEERWLVHGCLEGPEAGVYYRGKDIAPTTVKLPEYATKIADNFTVQVTPIGQPRLMSSTEVNEEGHFDVMGEGKFHWHATGRRLEIDPEPHKDDIVVHRWGPYSWNEELN